MRRIWHPRFLRGSRAVLRGSRCGILRPGRAQGFGELPVSSSYLNGKFKNATGYAINDFVNRYRILRSMPLLTGSDMRIYEVARAVGFEDYKYFIMVFKKYLGVSPAKFFETADRAPGESDSGRPAQTEKE